MPQPTSAAPSRLCELTRGEHMLLWSFRAAAFGAADCPLLRRQYEQACGPIGAEALNALVVFVRELVLHGRRRVSLCAPGSYRLSRDEQLILAVFAAAQEEDYDRLEAHLAWLVGAEPQRAFAAAACLVAEALGMNGLVLRAPVIEPQPAAWPAPSQGPSGVVVPMTPRLARR